MSLTTAASYRLWSKVLIAPFSECWEWLAYKTQRGYGTVRYNGKKTMAYRAIWQETKGQIPTGMHLDHICRNHGCVNPNHLRAVTPRENILFNSLSHQAKNFAKTHCKRGHEFTPDNILKPKGRPGRWCRICLKAKNKLWHEQHRGNNIPRHNSLK